MKISALFASALRVALAVALLMPQTLPAADSGAGNTVVDLLIQKARSLEARNRDDLAAQVWQQVLVANPNQPEALGALARWAKRSGRNADANGYLARLRAVAPDTAATSTLDSPDTSQNGSSRLEQAAKLAAGQHFDEAMRIYRDVFGSNPPAGGWSIAYYQTLSNTPGGFEPAIAALKKLAEAYPDFPDYKLTAGTLMTYRPATREAGIKMLSAVSGSAVAVAKAKVAWRQALVWEKTNPAYAPTFHEYLSRYPDAELQALATAMPVRNAQSEAPSSGSREDQLGYQALKNGDIAEAERQFTRGLTKDSNWRSEAGLGFASMKGGKFDAAVEQLEAAHQAVPHDATIRTALDTAKFWQAMNRGSKASDQQDWKKAVAFYGTAVALRPNDHDGLRGLGGSLLAAGSPDKAIPYLAKAARSQPADPAAWSALVRAKLEAEGGRAALAEMQSVPASAATALDGSVEWKALEALTYAEAGEDGRALSIYRDLVTSEHSALKPAEQLELASLALRFHQPAQAVPYAEKVVAAAPNQTGAWEVLLAALVASGKPAEAARAYARMPVHAQELASTHAGFQETLASLKEYNGDLEGARMLVEQLVEKSSPPLPEHDRTSARIHLAQILAKLGRAGEAETMISAITDAHPDDLDAWRAQLLILQSLHRSSDIVAAVAKMPQSLALRLGSQGDMVNLLASAHATNGDPEYGIRLLETYIARGDVSDGTNALPQRLQLGWLLLNSPRRSSRLYTLLNQLNARTDLTTDQRKEVSDLWVTWILRTADAARKSGNETRALAILEQGARLFPNNADVQRGLAGNLLLGGNTKRALNVYSNWGLSGAKPDDYAGAIGSALAEHNFQYADTWLDRALSQWPDNAKLLTLAGDRAQSRHDLKRAELFWKEALAQKQSEPSPASTPAEDPRPGSLRNLLVGPDGLRTSLQPASDLHSAASDDDATEVHLSNFQPGGPSPEESASASALTGDPLTAPATSGSSFLTKSVLATPSTADSLEDKIAAIESRNTPYVSSRMTVWGRGGQSGFSRLIIQQAQFEASTTLANQLRASLLLEPTYLSGGTADGSGTALFGRQTTPAGFGPQNNSGVAAEAQLSSQSFGLRVGVSPEGFLTHNWIGGLRLDPKNGPITFLLERDSVKDTTLSYSGGRDPQSGQIWGGVMANSASLQGHWGDDKSGVYVSGGYQALDGRNVARNTAENGNVGAWWKLATYPTGDFTVGMNFSAMHYAHNLRYFTFGQGGYFSPQQYMLFNIPIRWTGSYGHRLQYTIGGSLGSQHFTEDASAYYPNDPVLQALQKNPKYPAYGNTGANFGFDARLSYQMAPHWMLGAFATANNARDYTAAAAGLFVKYTFEERPMSIESAVPSLPDWRGQQPFMTF